MIEHVVADPISRDLRVFISTRDSRCDEWAKQLGRRAWIFLAGDRGALCLACADLDHLVFLPSGDAALTRRARKHSTLAAVVLKWSAARKRYERQGMLVEEQALEKAEAACLSDAEARARRREREAERGTPPRCSLHRAVCEQNPRVLSGLRVRSSRTDRRTRVPEIQRAGGTLFGGQTPRRGSGAHGGRGARAPRRDTVR